MYDDASEDNDKNNTLDKPLKLSGEIYVRYEQGNTRRLLYERKGNEVETVSFDSPLNLRAAYCAFPSSFGMHFHANLIVENTEVCTSDKLEVDIEDRYERLMSTKLNDNGYSVVIEYFVMQCSFPCMLKVELKNLGLKSKLFPGGKVFARYEDTRNLKEEKYPEFLLHSIGSKSLDAKPDHSYVELKWICVAIPPYLSLTIKVDLGDRRNRVYTFRSGEQFIKTKSYSIMGISLEVTVDWFNRTEQGEINSRQLPLDKDKLLCDNYDVGDKTRDDFDNERDPMFVFYYYTLLYEVFSVFIGRKSGQAVALHGTVKVYAGNNVWCLFDRRENDAQVLQASEKMLRIKGPPEPFMHGFYGPLVFALNLKDKWSPLRIKGSNDWCIIDNYERLRDIRLLDVYVGNTGYAAIHYMRISHAFGVSIKVEAIGLDIMDGTANVRGSIYAHYGIHNYNSNYEKHFYRSVMFKEGSLELPVKEGKCEIPLGKKILCIDWRPSLCLDVNVAMVVKGKEETTNAVLFERERENLNPLEMIMKLRIKTRLFGFVQLGTTQMAYRVGGGFRGDVDVSVVRLV